MSLKVVSGFALEWIDPLGLLTLRSRFSRKRVHVEAISILDSRTLKPAISMMLRKRRLGLDTLLHVHLPSPGTPLFFGKVLL